ncbi:S9 family peptidase [Dyadobacter chenwenxiniae]|uniref:Proline-specific endopeptidase n=1 Tax=Dyadobacter chenwenxiniae TaxID=2906456 RepID=A0A9X1PLE3_9BACT|nr:S9 family peptidase [Dyadobacter chenwenxiniae]MCF0063008.1 S9 family peptidase [Dyadobacter chenwenxiniae]UON84819.1 S9 family peptidase [Dyadobacter chenwenxiniae]
MRIILPFLAVIIFSCNQNKDVNEAYQWPGATPPVAEMKDHETGMHGDKRNDEYYWMADFFSKGPDSNKVVDYLKAENAYTDTMMADTKKFEEDLFAEMKGRIKEKDESVPVFSNGYWYYTRSEEGQQYFKYCRKKGSLDAKEEMLLDVDKMAEGHPYYSAVGFNVSPDNKLLAYGVDTVSRRQYTIYVKNLETGELIKDAIFPASGGSEWGNDNKTLFYTATNPKTLLSEKIKRHTLGTDPKKDVVVYAEKDKSNYIGVGKTKSEKYIIIASSATMSSEYRILDADKPEGDFEVFQPRMKNVLYDIDHQNDKFLVVTNKDALNFKLMETPLNNTGVEHWKEVIPTRKDVLLEGIDVFKDFLVITERKNGLLQLRIRNVNNNAEHYVDFGEPAYTAYASSNPEYDSKNLRYVYTSLTTPNSVYDYNMETKGKELKKRQEVIGGYNPEEYVTERLYAEARDGVKIPISLVYKKGTEKNEKTPLLLYAYGSYGNSMDAAFSSTRLSLLDRGFIYAIAHVRGGQEMGRQWYEDGKLFKKKNTFFDFIDCAEYLIKGKFTSPAHLYAEGGSAGGLLMGAISNLRPDLWRGIIADVPFVDVVTTMLDESIPLTTNEFDEWGNPKNKEFYTFMKSYSPYDNVEKKAYPNMLVTTGLHDSQVQYFEPAKWVARLRTHKTDKNVLLLKTNMEAGHGGASGRFEYLKEVALQFAFMFALEGIRE